MMYKHNQKVQVKCKHDKTMGKLVGVPHEVDTDEYWEAYIKQGEILECSVYIFNADVWVLDFEHIAKCVDTGTSGRLPVEFELDPQSDDFSFYFEIMENNQ